MLSTIHSNDPPPPTPPHTQPHTPSLLSPIATHTHSLWTSPHLTSHQRGGAVACGMDDKVPCTFTDTALPSSSLPLSEHAESLSLTTLCILTTLHRNMMTFIIVKLRIEVYEHNATSVCTWDTLQLFSALVLCCEASEHLHCLGLVSSLVTTVPTTGKQLPCFLLYPLFSWFQIGVCICM